MKIPKLLKWELLEIDWLDSGHSSGWMNEDDVSSSDTEIHFKSLGYFLKDGPLSITIVQSYGGQHSDNTFQIDARMTIPKCAITNIRKI